MVLKVKLQIKEIVHGHVIRIPKAFMDIENLKTGDKVTVIFNDDDKE